MKKVFSNSSVLMIVKHMGILYYVTQTLHICYVHYVLQYIPVYFSFLIVWRCYLSKINSNPVL